MPKVPMIPQSVELAIRQVVFSLAETLESRTPRLIACIRFGMSLFGTICSFFIFAWACFFRPIGNADGSQKDRLDSFYGAQASIYDATRTRLLKGRHTLLRLCAAHLRQLTSDEPRKRPVWVDVGGGTGFNIEEMNEYYPIEDFEAIYLIDLCKPLLDVAQKRFAARGWTNVHVLCQDTTFFSLPEWESTHKNPRGSVSLFTLSYSLSMIPSYFQLLNRIDDLLDPAGLLGVADFYTSSRASTPLERAIGNGAERQTGFLSRWFWQIWFDLDHVSLSSSRREYLEYRFGTIKSYNGRNHVLPWIVQIPYYVWLGCSRTRSTERAFRAFEIESGNTAGSGHLSPLYSPATSEASTAIELPELDIGPAAIAVPSTLDDNSTATKKGHPLPLSSFHYHSKNWRLPFLEKPEHSEFRTWIYGFTWEDPEADMRWLDIQSDDTLLVITSAGDNALHYAIAGRPRRIHCVDMNPPQGHLLELKLAAASALSHEEMWAMFGEGKIDGFEEILDRKLSPFLSSPAYQFWRANASTFQAGFHTCGYSGHALRLARWAFKIGGVSGWVRRMAEAPTIKEQGRIWDQHVRPVLLAPWITRLFLANPIFLWNALGVPMNQMTCFLNEGISPARYAKDTLDPIAHHTHMRNGAYHYLLCLLGRYTRQSCPLYLSTAGFTQLQVDDGALLDTFRLHTDSIINVLQGLGDESVTKMVVMDHMDWFDSKAAASCPLDEEIIQMHRVLRFGGAVYWRSAACRPWYIARFEKLGFKVEALAIRTPGSRQPIDRVNMYASFYRALKE